MTTGELIRKCRKDAGLTQRELGARSGIAEPTIRKYESNRLNPKIETIQKIASALGVTADYLVGRTNDPHTKLATQEDIDRFFGGASYTTKDGVAVTTTPNAVSTLTHYFNLLNDKGQAVAVDRVKELSEIPRYKK